MKYLNVTKDDNILVIAPHPDDESIGTGGLISLYPNNCEIWCMTDGSSYGIKDSQKNVSAIRIKEFAEVLDKAGITRYKKYDYPNGELINHIELCNYINLSKYSKIFIPHRNEAHSDHKAVYGIIKKYSEGSKYSIPEVYQYETRMPVDTATHYLDITDVIEKKLLMIGTYKSQCNMYNYVDFARSMAKFIACRQNSPQSYYESYTKIDFEDLNSQNIDDIQSRDLADYRKKNAYLEMWLYLEMKGIGPARYLSNNYKSIAIYGFGYFGKILYNDFKSNKVTITCILDKNADKLKGEVVDIRYPNEYEDIEIVVITNINEIQSINENLHKLGYKTIDLWDVFMEILEEEHT